jgi:hypothetical protein
MKYGPEKIVSSEAQPDCSFEGAARWIAPSEGTGLAGPKEGRSCRFVRVRTRPHARDRVPPRRAPPLRVRDFRPEREARCVSSARRGPHVGSARGTAACNSGVSSALVTPPA